MRGRPTKIKMVIYKGKIPIIYIPEFRVRKVDEFVRKLQDLIANNLIIK